MAHPLDSLIDQIVQQATQMLAAQEKLKTVADEAEKRQQML